MRGINGILLYRQLAWTQLGAGSKHEISRSLYVDNQGAVGEVKRKLNFTEDGRGESLTPDDLQARSFKLTGAPFTCLSGTKVIYKLAQRALGRHHMFV